MKIKMKVTGCCRTLIWGTCTALLLTASLQADSVLWSNYGGNQSNINFNFGSDNRCDASCGAQPNVYTVFDNFTTGNPGWTVNKFVYYDFFNNTPTSEYTSTAWSIWKGDPLSTSTPGTLVASGTTTGALPLNPISGTCGPTSTCLETITVTLPTGVTLASGTTYYLGISNNLKAGNDATDRAVVSQSFNGPLPTWEQSNGTINGTLWQKGGQDNTFPSANPAVNATDTAFDIIGVPTPEPGSITLMTLAIAGLGFVIRRRRTA